MVNLEALKSMTSKLGFSLKSLKSMFSFLAYDLFEALGDFSEATSNLTGLDRLSNLCGCV